MDSERVLLPFTILLNSVWRRPLPNNLIGKEATLIAYLANLLVHLSLSSGLSRLICLAGWKTQVLGQKAIKAQMLAGSNSDRLRLLSCCCPQGKITMES